MEDPIPPNFNDTKFIPDELIAKICVRLPAKCIGKFRTVSKAWNSLLSEPQFITNHHNRIRNFPNEDEQQSLLLHSKDSLFCAHLKIAHQVFDEMTVFATKLIFTGIDPLLQEDIDFLSVYSMPTCDGLVLLRDYDANLLLINPTIKQVKQLPHCDLDPDEVTTMYGLGFDSVHDDYKVVSISSDPVAFDEDPYDDANMFVSVYSLRSGKWDRALNPVFDHGVLRFQGPGVFVNGRIHWLAFRMSNGSCVILAFDFGKQKFNQVPLPSSIKTIHFGSHRLVALGGCLSIYPFWDDSDVWVMKEYGVEESWTIFAAIHTGGLMFEVKCFSGREQLVLVKLDDLHRLVVYNREDATLKDIVVQGIPSKYIVGGNYLESLVPPYYNN